MSGRGFKRAETEGSLSHPETETKAARVIRVRYEEAFFRRKQFARGKKHEEKLIGQGWHPRDCKAGAPRERSRARDPDAAKWRKLVPRNRGRRGEGNEFSPRSFHREKRQGCFGVMHQSSGVATVWADPLGNQKHPSLLRVRPATALPTRARVELESARGPARHPSKSGVRGVLKPRF